MRPYELCIRSPQGRRDLQGPGCEVPAFAGTTRILRLNDACDQCTGWRDDGAMGSCRWLGASLHVQCSDSMRSMLRFLDTISSALLHWPTRHVVAQAPHHLSY